MNTAKRQYRSGKALVVIIIIVLAIGGLIVFLPAIASKWPGPGIVKGLVEDNVNGQAEVGRVTLRWFGPQTIDHLVIRDQSGEEVADLGLDIDTTLLRLATGNMKSYDITIQGDARGDIDDNGSVSFVKLIKRGDASAAGEKESKPAGTPPLEGLVPVKLQLVNFSLKLREPDRDPMVLTIDAADISAAPGRPIVIGLNGNMNRGTAKGAVSFNLVAENLLGENGEITPVGATLQSKMNANDVPLPRVTQLDHIDGFSAAAISSDLSDRLEVSVNVVSAISASALLGVDNGPNGDDSAGESSTIAAQIVLHQPIDAQLKTHIDATTISGSVNVIRLPSELLRIFALDPAIDPKRDIGPYVDLTADFGAGERRDLNITATAKRFDVRLAGLVDADTKQLDINDFNITAQLHPELVKDLANVVVDQSATVHIAGGPAHVPGIIMNNGDGAARRDWTHASGAISIAMDGPLEISNAQAASLGTVRDFKISINSENLGSGARIVCTAGVNGGSLNMDEVVGNIVTPTGEFNTDWNTLEPVGTITLRDLAMNDPAFLPAELPGPVKEFASGALNAQVSTKRDATGNLNAQLDVATDKLSFSAAATRQDDRLRIDRATAKATVEPALVRSLQADRTQPIELSSPLPVTVSLSQPVSLRKNSAGGYDKPTGSVYAAVETDRAIALDHVPALIEPLELRDTAINIVAPLTASPGAVYEIAASVLWHTRTTDRTVGDAIIEVTYPTQSAGTAADAATTSATIEPTIKLSLERLAVRRLERAMGREKDSLAKWLGGSGDLYIDITPDAAMENYHGTIETQFQHLTGNFEFNYASTAGLFAVTAGRATTTLTANALNDALKMTPADAQSIGEAADAHRSWVISDVPANMTINNLQLPLGLMNGEPFDPQLVRMDIQTGLGAIVLADATRAQATIGDVTAEVTADDLRQPVGVKLSGTVRPPGDAKPGAINLDAKVKRLLSQNNTFDFSGAVIDMTLNGRKLPLVIADSLGEYDGLLLAALGVTADADVTTEAFSGKSGSMTANLTTPNGTMKATLLGRDETLRIKKDKPTTAELALTPEFRDRVLAKIHPLFADIKQTKQPIRATITSAKVPLNGDVAQLDADLEITVGDLEFTSGSALLTVMKLFQQTGVDSVPGRIEPIKAKVRNGVVTYDTFAAVIDKYTMNFSGEVNLNTRKVDLRWELPLEALAMTFKELAPYAKDIVIPLRTHGEIGNVKTDVAPDFNIAEAALKAGFQGQLGGGDGNGGGGFDLGRILDDVLNKNKKKDSEKNPKDDK